MCQHDGGSTSYACNKHAALATIQPRSSAGIVFCLCLCKSILSARARPLATTTVVVGEAVTSPGKTRQMCSYMSVRMTTPFEPGRQKRRQRRRQWQQQQHERVATTYFWAP